MFVTFLEASVPLTKTFSMKAGMLTKTPYPFVWEFTSHIEEVKSLRDFESALIAHARLGHCMLKGTLNRPLVNESRAGSTQTGDMTEFLVLDIDGLDAPRIDSLLVALGMDDISHIIQWSASQGISDKLLHAHVIFMLDKPYAAPLLKQRLIQFNHEVPMLSSSMTLTKTGNSIHWPLDISACQNDKLIYISAPVLKGMKDPLGKQPRIELVHRPKHTFSLIGQVNSTDRNRELTNAAVMKLREKAGLPKRKITYKMHGTTEVMIKPDSAVITEMKTERGFVYFNLNGGDSWAYYHPENNPDYIYSFKGEPAYLTKELLPDYWEQLHSAVNSTVTSQGMLKLAFLDRATSTYWRGSYDTNIDKLELYAAKNETQVRHFAKQTGTPLGDYIPEWDITFDPTDNVRVDTTNKTINLFQPSTYMLAQVKPTQAVPKVILKVLDHALGNDPAVLAHFLNWLAFILQKRDRTKTAWVLHGVPGCLAGETVLDFSRGARNGGRPLTIKEAYQKWTGTYQLGMGRGKTWDMKIATRTKSVRDGMSIGFHEVHSILESGVKQLYRLQVDSGHAIRATAEHPFMRPDGTFTQLQDLKPGDEILREGMPINALPRGGRNKTRHTTYSIPHHPFAWQHVIAGKNYKRMHTARLVVEADMNKLNFDVFIDILRHHPDRAAQLVYLPEDAVVHHLDEDPSNDALDNLALVDKLNHDAHHAKEVGIGYIGTRTVKVKSIKKDRMEMTYDIVMKAPYHNYVANGFVVHNTGKGLLTSDILRPILGPNQTATRRMEELNEPYNHFMRNSFLVVVDEVQTKALQNERGVMAKLKNFITEPMVPIRMMYSNAVEMRNYTNWMFLSNMSDPVSIDKGDRRFNVAKYQTQKLVITDKEIAQIPSELQAFHDYLMTYAVDVDAARTVLQNQDRATMISISESSIDSVTSALLEGSFEFFMDQLPTSDAYKANAAEMNKVENYRDVLKALLLRTDLKDGNCSISRDELRVLADYTVGGMPTSPNKFTSLLKHHRIHIGPVWVPSKTVNGIKVTWKDTKAWKSYTDVLTPPAPSKVVPLKPRTKARA